ncbi:DDE_3 domain-containing protein [Trichonephila clavipes]|nr:DDE_3 domain-containing protein [Trichonephila clavipes]
MCCSAIYCLSIQWQHSQSVPRLVFLHLAQSPHVDGEVMKRLVSRYIHQAKKQLRQDGVNEDDLLEIKQDISSLRRFNGLARHHVGWPRTSPCLERGSVTGMMCRDDVLEPCVLLLRGACDPEFILMHDKARPHRALLVDEFLESEDIRRMDWPARSPDLNPIEQCSTNLFIAADWSTFDYFTAAR